MGGLYILFWEQWRQTWKALLFMAIALIAYAIAFQRIDDLVKYIFSNNYGLAVGVAYLPTLGAIVFTFLQDNRNRTGFAYPRRTLVLPVRTGILVAAPMLYKLAVGVGFVALSGWAVDSGLKVLFYHSPQILLVIPAIIALQALVFLTCGFGTSTGVALFTAALLLTAPIVYFCIDAVAVNLGIPPQLPPLYTPPTLSSMPWIAAPFAALIWWVIAWSAARRARSEIPEDPVGKWTKALGNLAFLEGRRENFRSPAEAQRWFEWHRGAYLYPWVTLGTGIVLLAISGFALAELESRFLVTFNLLAVAPAVIASLTGYTVTRVTDEYLWFAGPRPMSTADMARARLKAAVKGILSGYILLAIVFLCAYRFMFPQATVVSALVEDLRVMTTTSGPFWEGAAMLSAIAVLIVLAVWALFWTARAAGVLAWLAGMVAGAWYYVAGGLYVASEDGFITPAFVFAIAFTLLIVAGTILAFAFAIRAKLIRLSAVGIAGIGWIGACSLLFLFQELMKPAQLVLCAAALMLPFAPIATVPLSWHLQRHR